MNYTNLEKVIFISIVIMILFTAFNSASNLSGHLMKSAGFGDLGFTNLAIVYLFVSITSLFSTGIVTKLGIKLSFFVTSMCYCFWVLTFILPSLY